MPKGYAKSGINKGQFKKGHIPWIKGKSGVMVAWNKGIPCSEETKRKISESHKTGKFMNCEVCGKEFWVIKSAWDVRKYCSRKCYWVVGIERIRKQGLNNRKYNTKEELHQANLASGRKCYRKHIEQRRFYYRELNCKRRNVGGKHSYGDWREMKEKYNYTCQICGKKEPEITLTEDHIIPISRWNEWIKEHSEITYQCNDIENIQPLCGKCNGWKWGKIL